VSARSHKARRDAAKAKPQRRAPEPRRALGGQVAHLFGPDSVAPEEVQRLLCQKLGLDPAQVVIVSGDGPKGFTQPLRRAGAPDPARDVALLKAFFKDVSETEKISVPTIIEGLQNLSQKVAGAMNDLHQAGEPGLPATFLPTALLLAMVGVTHVRLDKIPDDLVSPFLAWARWYSRQPTCSHEDCTCRGKTGAGQVH
jgi:hypothetical protein